MTDLSRIIADLTSKASVNESRAFSILGAHPGPGIDIIFLPDLPVAHAYTIKVLTPAGLGFMRVLYNSQGRISEGWELVKMKRELAEFGLSFHTEWDRVVEEVR